MAGVMLTDDEREFFRRFWKAMKDESAARRKATAKGMPFEEVAQRALLEGILYARRADAGKRVVAALAEQSELEHACSEAYAQGYAAGIKFMARDVPMTNAEAQRRAQSQHQNAAAVVAQWHANFTTTTPDDARMGYGHGGVHD